MRLLRLVSNKPTNILEKSEFENHFLDNIILPAKSKIGLLSASVPINLKEIHINSTNNTFRFRTRDKNKDTGLSQKYHIVNLGGENIYDVDEFIKLFKLKTWQTLSFNITSDIGFYLNLVINSKGFFTIFKSNIHQKNMLVDEPLFTLLRNVTTANNSLQVQVAGQANQSYAYSKIPMITSCGYLRVTLTRIGNMILGLTNTFTGNVDLTDNDVIYAIKCQVSQAGQRDYFYKDTNGQWIDLGIDVQNNDVIALEIEGGNLYHRIYRNNNEVISEEITLGDMQVELLHPVIGLREDIVITSYPTFFYHPDIKLNASNNLVYSEATESIFSMNDEDDNVELGLGAMPGPNPNLSNQIFKLEFTKVGLQNILGYEQNRLSYKGQSTMFVANTPYNKLSIPSTILVELLTLKLSSYDGLTSSRRNIVAVIPNQVSSSTGRLLYSVPNPIMMDIDNQFDINLRSIRVRVMSGDDEGSLLEIFDRMELTFILD